VRSAGLALALGFGLVLGLGSSASAGSVKLPKARTFLDEMPWTHHAPYSRGQALPRARTAVEQLGWERHAGHFESSRYGDIAWGRRPVRMWPNRKTPASLGLP
jgi:hypothetical protein